MNSSKDPVKSALIAICAVIAAIIPILNLRGQHRPGFMEWAVNLICVAAFYFGSRKLLRNLETLQQEGSDSNGIFSKIHTSVSDLSLIGLSTVTIAWALSDFIHR